MGIRAEADNLAFEIRISSVETRNNYESSNFKTQTELLPILKIRDYFGFRDSSFGFESEVFRIAQHDTGK